MKRLTLLSFLGLLVIIIIVAFSQSPNKYLDYKKDMKARGEKPMSFSDYKKPFMKVPIINIDIFKK